MSNHSQTVGFARPSYWTSQSSAETSPWISSDRHAHSGAAADGDSAVLLWKDLTQSARLIDARESQILANNGAAAGMPAETILAHLLQAGFDRETAMKMTEEAIERAPAVKAYHDAHIRDANKDWWHDWLVAGAIIALVAAFIYFEV